MKKKITTIGVLTSFTYLAFPVRVNFWKWNSFIALLHSDLATALQRRCGKVMFSAVSICHSACPRGKGLALVSLCTGPWPWCPPDMFKLVHYEARGQLASYWNAFLLINYFSDRQKRRTDPLQPISFIFATQGHSTGMFLHLSEIYAGECGYDAFTPPDSET